MTGENNSRPKLNRSQEKERTCLAKLSPKCKKKFLSLHPGIRVCSHCRESQKQVYGGESQSLSIRR